MLSELENQNSKDKVSVKVSTLLSVKKYRRYSSRYIGTKVSAIPILKKYRPLIAINGKAGEGKGLERREE
jgi:hypothetical protein